MIASITLAIMLALAPLQTIEPMDSDGQELDYMGTYTISAYNVYEGYGENEITASGATPKAYVTVATSSEIPFGTTLYIEDIGEVVVEDRGGSLIESGARIDLFIGTDSTEDFGLQQKEVYFVRR